MVNSAVAYTREKWQPLWFVHFTHVHGSLLGKGKKRQHE
jgi:hypothetical protein